MAWVSFTWLETISLVHCFSFAFFQLCISLHFITSFLIPYIFQREIFIQGQHKVGLVAQKLFSYKHKHCLQWKHKKIFGPLMILNSNWHSMALKACYWCKIGIRSHSLQWDFKFFPIHLNEDKQIFYLSFPCKNKLWSDEGLAESDQLSTCM